MKRLILATLFDRNTSLEIPYFHFDNTNLLLDNNYLGSFLLPFRIINNGNPTSIRLPSINKKIFRFIYPFLQRYPMEDYSLKAGLKPNHIGKYYLLNFSKFFKLQRYKLKEQN